MRALLALALALVACSNAGVPSDAGADSPPDSALDAAAGVRTFVFRKMFAGDSDRSFKASATAWQTFGEDIDGTSGASCKSAIAQVDGDGGIDNAFGATVLPLLQMNGFAIPSLQWSESIQQGAARAVLVRTEGASAEVRVGALLPMAPDFSGAGSWSVSSLVAADMGDVQTQLGLVTAKSASAPVVLYVPFSNRTLELKVHRFSFHASDSMQGGSIF